jgi:hypothetical protein
MFDFRALEEGMSEGDGRMIASLVRRRNYEMAGDTTNAQQQRRGNVSRELHKADSCISLRKLVEL